MDQIMNLNGSLVNLFLVKQICDAIQLGANTPKHIWKYADNVANHMYEKATSRSKTDMSIILQDFKPILMGLKNDYYNILSAFDTQSVSVTLTSTAAFDEKAGKDTLNLFFVCHGYLHSETITITNSPGFAITVSRDMATKIHRISNANFMQLVEIGCTLALLFRSLHKAIAKFKGTKFVADWDYWAFWERNVEHFVLDYLLVEGEELRQSVINRFYNECMLTGKKYKNQYFFADMRVSEEFLVLGDDACDCCDNKHHFEDCYHDAVNLVDLPLVSLIGDENCCDEDSAPLGEFPEIMEKFNVLHEEVICLKDRLEELLADLNSIVEDTKNNRVKGGK